MRVYLPLVTSTFIALVFTGCVTTHTKLLLLDDLATELTATRNSAHIYRVECPRAAHSLVGLSKKVVVSKLGAADFTDEGQEWYSFVKHFDPTEYGKIRVDKDGVEYIKMPPHSGWTNIGFTYDSMERVVRTDCRYPYNR